MPAVTNRDASACVHIRGVFPGRSSPDLAVPHHPQSHPGGRRGGQNSKLKQEGSQEEPQVAYLRRLCVLLTFEAYRCSMFSVRVDGCGKSACCFGCTTVATVGVGCWTIKTSHNISQLSTFRCDHPKRKMPPEHFRVTHRPMSSRR